jgi:RND family efflux transporter MFP subunit
MNKIIKIVAFVVMIAIFVWGIYILFIKKELKEETEVVKAEEKKEAAKTKTQEARLPVTVLKIKRGDLPLRLPISATADVWEKATIKAEVAGTVEAIHYSIGDYIPKGKLLVKLDDSEIKLQVDRAEANRLQSFSKYLISESIKIQENNEISEQEKENLKTLESKYIKALATYKKGQISEDKFDEISENYQEALVYSGSLRDDIRKAHEGLSNANIALKEAKLNFRRASIKSPFPGIISDIMISKGEKITINQEILKIVNLQTIYLKGFALESEIKHLKKGIGVRIKFDSFPDRYFYGTIASVSPEIDPQNKTISIYVDVDNKENLILPGMHAEIDVEYKVFKDVLKVPIIAVIPRGERPTIFTVKENTANWEYVEVGEKNDEEWIIKKGLNKGIKEGDLVIIDGHLTLSHQARVRIVKTIEQE